MHVKEIETGEEWHSINPKEIVINAINNLPKITNMKNIYNELILISTDLIQRNPNYNKVAARITSEIN